MTPENDNAAALAGARRLDGRTGQQRHTDPNFNTAGVQGASERRWVVFIVKTSGAQVVFSVYGEAHSAEATRKQLRGLGLDARCAEIHDDSIAPGATLRVDALERRQV